MAVERLSTACDATNRSARAVTDGVHFLEGLPALPDGYDSPVEVVPDPFDIDSLRYTEPQVFPAQKKKINLVPASVRDFVRRMNELSEKSKKMFVIGIGTGGTISMSPTGPDRALEPDLDFNKILKKADPRLKREFEVMGIDAFATDSSQLDIGDVGDLAITMSYIWKEMKPSLRSRFAGFLVVHGTDTMPKASAHLEMMLGKNMPFNIVHTGAQKSINESINDAQDNVKNAMYMLMMLHRGNFAEGVTVMGGVGLLTCGIDKVNDHRARAMDTKMHEFVVDFGDLPDPKIHRLPEWLRERPGTRPFNPVVYRGPNRIGEITAEMEEDPRAIMAVVKLAARKAILLTTYGASTFDMETMRLIAAEARKHGILPFAVSPVDADPRLDIYAASEAMIEAGVIPLYMTRAAARAKLMRAFALFGNRNPIGVREFMTDNFIGEIPTRANRRRNAA